MTDIFQDLRDALLKGVGSSTAKRPKKTGPPHQGPTHLNHLVGEFTVKVDTYTDGTVTEVVAQADGDGGTHVRGRGVARRRKGDPRNIETGHTIALARALRDMADTIEAELLR